MRGTPTAQAKALLTKSGILQLGTSKGVAKEWAKNQLREQGQPVTSASISANTGIYGLRTTQQYASVWKQLAVYARENFGLKDIERLAGVHVVSYLDYKAEIGLGRDALNKEMAAINKMEQALNKWAVLHGRNHQYDLKQAVETFREDVARDIPRNDMIRAYPNPSELVSAVPLGTAESLAVRILAESGCRIGEGTHIAASQLRGMATDEHTGKSVGRFSYIGKGGKLNSGNLSPETYSSLEKHIREHGMFESSQEAVRNTIRTAAEATGQEYAGHGAHGLRWNFATARMEELQEHGMSRDEALAQVSREMSHNRAEITEHYLRR
ncbi:hypothetical protein KP005_04660 [Geomonas nitrogeniifigens]|uniref:Tyr recombinase domain-containing protein n=1 Tax=Geomonas diazotrophica TaxID=2843197 RepID=A0ABX8JJN3_9BACT|nr:hypothetical protein [Geomonas nitrogeniifigens]QWV98585.1 hypothetical protein KP005_04660 [Geomonas nitrogeniifigens]